MIKDFVFFVAGAFTGSIISIFSMALFNLSHEDDDE